MSMDLDDLQLLLDVAELGSFSVTVHRDGVDSTNSSGNG